MSTNTFNKKPDSPSLFSRLIDGRWLLLGCLFGFACCILEGHLVAPHNYMRNFKRFNIYTGFQTQFFPTIRLLRALARSKLNQSTDKHAVLVIIGGDSILQGYGHSLDKLWSERLQDLLGDKFCVVNLAMRGSPPTGGAECVAEYFIKTNKPVIYVGDVGAMDGVAPDGGSIYRYQYWQAQKAGFLLPNPAREESARSHDLNGQEQLRTGLGEYLRFDDLWSYFTYNYLTTVWSAPIHNRWWYPRILYDDEQTDAVSPVPQRFEGPNAVLDTNNVRDYSQNNYTLDGNGHWQEVPKAWDQSDAEFATAFLPIVRKHTVLVRVQNAPYYRNLLTPAEQERDRLAVDGALHHLNALGFDSVAFGDNFIDEDFYDHAHLTASGGKKLADLVAPEILSVARRLYGIEATLK